MFEIGLKEFLKSPKTFLTDQDKAITKAINNTLDTTYHVFCQRHCQENAFKHISSLINTNCFLELSVEDKIKLHRKVLGLYNEFSLDKAKEDITYLTSNLPESEVKNYFLNNLEKIKEKIFPPFIRTFVGLHYTTNIAESINNIIRTLKVVN